jgi:hypothetical protein
MEGNEERKNQGNWSRALFGMELTFEKFIHF